MKEKLIESRSISGFNDYTEAENVELSAWILAIEETYRRFGFSRLLPRPLERRSVLLSRGGIQKQIFGVSRLPEDEPTDLALPFDRTVPLANWVAMNAKRMVFPYKRYDVSYSYRGERAQAGRFQGFFQADVDIIGRDTLDLNADAECIAVVVSALQQLPFSNLLVAVNNIQLTQRLLRDLQLDAEAVRPALTLLDKLPQVGKIETCEELVTSLGLQRHLADEIVDVFSFEGKPQDFRPTVQQASTETSRVMDDVEFVWQALLDLGVPEPILSFRPGIVRGLDYYTGTVFETFIDGAEYFGSVASGGRYEDLVSTFCDLELPGVGGSIGLSRLFDVAKRLNLLDLEKSSEANILVGFRTPDLRSVAQVLATHLREAGRYVDLYSASDRVKKQFSYADRKGMEWVIMVMASDSIVVKDLKSGNQVDTTDVENALDVIEQLAVSVAA